MIFLHYPKCTTCKRALKWLKENQIKVEERHIVECPPTKEELQSWLAKSQLPIKKFFNTSGMVYKELGLKDKLPHMTEEEAITLLSSNGMLVKRPLLVGEEVIVVGFKEEEYKTLLK